MEAHPRKFTRRRQFIANLAALILLFMVGYLLLRAFPQIRGANYGHILHSVPNPDSIFIVYVRNTGCGDFAIGKAANGCCLLIQLGEKGHPPPPIDPFLNRYEIPGECDAQVKWLDYAHFEVTGSSGKIIELNLTDDFPVMP